MTLFIRQAWLVLVLALCFGVALAGVNEALKDRIIENARMARELAAVEVFVPADATAEQAKAFMDSTTAAAETVAGQDVYRITGADGKQLGWAVPAQGQGYADTIKLVAGVSPDGKQIAGVKIVYNQETPGLGNKIVDKSFRQRFAGKPADVQLVAAKKTSGFAANEIQAITGATISSKAVCDITSNQLNKGGLLEELARKAK